ncbi:hypothetical protein MCOR06_011096 [Pyricularia oryzae]|nr:hypothetical protein MCOR06_011096 [Pyricularia oryzae]
MVRSSRILRLAGLILPFAPAATAARADPFPAIYPQSELHPYNWTVHVDPAQLHARQIPSTQDTSLSHNDCEAIKPSRTGTWHLQQCTMKAVRTFSFMIPNDRWKEMECDAAWHDLKNHWLGCSPGPSANQHFDAFVAKFFHVDGIPGCGGLDSPTNCNIVGCNAYSSINEDQEIWTGACGYEIWNAMAKLHGIIFNYFHEVKRFGDGVVRETKSFMDTFAGSPDTGKTDEILNLLVQIPLVVAFPRSFASTLLREDFFGNNARGDRAKIWEESIRAMTSVVFDASQKAAAKEETYSHRDMNFKEIFETTTAKWKSQFDKLAKTLFDGSPASLSALDKIFREGQMLPGRTPKDRQQPRLETWEQRQEEEKDLERVFYATAIPAAWKGSGQTPVVLRLGDTCQIDARKYFDDGPESYNRGWRCIDGHSYILAGVRERDPPSASSNPRFYERPTVGQRRKFQVLKGIDELQRNSRNGWAWKKLSVDDFIVGAINTYNIKNKNDFSGLDFLNGNMTNIMRDIMEMSMLKKPGLVRIPICNVEEAWDNFVKTRANRAKSPNWPCNL